MTEISGNDWKDLVNVNQVRIFFEKIHHQQYIDFNLILNQ